MKFLNKIFSPICLCFSITLLLYTFYRSEIYWKGELSTNHYLFFYISSLLLLIFSIFSFFVKKETKQYLIILLLSIIVSLYLFELYLEFKPEISNKEKKYFKQKTGKKYDTRSKFEVYTDQLKIDIGTVLTVYPFSRLNKKNNLFPLSGISNSNTLYCNENGYFVNYQSDRYGFNNPDKEWDQEEIEFLLLGDSFLHGACVNRPNDITSVLRNLSNKSALNLGYAGNGPLIQLATLKEYLNTNVKKVIWFYYEGNDLYNLKNEIENDLLNKYLININFKQNLQEKQNQINKLGKQRINDFLLTKHEIGAKTSARLIKVIKLRRLRKMIMKTSIPQPKVMDDFTRVLKLAKKLTAKNNSDLYFVYLPEINRYLTKYNNTNYQKVKMIVTNLNIPFIDIHEEVFKKQKDPEDLVPFLLQGGGHYNKLGYKKVADILLKYTQD